MKTFSIHPRITFQDTNVVGNVYFLTFFRWQQECCDRWLRDERPDLWREINSGGVKLPISHWETRFSDPFGATICDQIEVVLAERPSECEGMSLSTEVYCTRGSARARIASGEMSHHLNSNNVPLHACSTLDHGYAMTVEVPCHQAVSTLDLLGWQGKCRELFLADHSPDVLQKIVDRKLILQTTSASVDLLQQPADRIEQVRIEMRLVSIKCGQMTVQFEYLGRLDSGSWEHFATGSQVMSSKNSAINACTLPDELLLALRQFTECEKILVSIDTILQHAPRNQSVVTTNPPVQL